MKNYDVTALGELLVDFTENGFSGQGNYLFEANPGGAPCNVLAMLGRLGKKTAFIGKVGDDFLGRHLRDVVARAGIDTRGLLLDGEAHTTLAFVHTQEDGDRDFSFYRDPGADRNLKEGEIDGELIAASRIFHFGSLSLTHEPVRAAIRKALRIARENGCIVTFDPNLREPLWRTLDEAREQIAFGMGQCDVLKISDNEIRWFTGRQDFDEGIAALRRDYDIPLILLSMGKDGSRAYYRDMRVEGRAFPQEETIETTGAGDTFCACALGYVLDHGLEALTEENLKEMLTFANAAAALITTRKGALRVMPTREEVERLLAGVSARFTFREIRAGEAGEAARIERICFPPNEACSAAQMISRAAAAPEVFFVALEKETGRMAGFLNGLATDEETFRDAFFEDASLHKPDGRNIMLLGLDVLPEYRGQGLAREIVSRYSRRERERGREKLILTCLEAKVGMYEKMGFCSRGIADSSWGGEQWYEMVRTLLK